MLPRAKIMARMKGDGGILESRSVLDLKSCIGKVGRGGVEW